MDLKLTAACGCNTGKYRAKNEDNFYFNGTFMDEDNRGLEDILEVIGNNNDSTYYGVFDGMGGQADGQVAAAISAETFALLVQGKPNTVDVASFLKDIMHKMSKAVFDKAEETANNMGSTASVIVIENNVYHVCNVGDSPVFLYRKGVLRQISINHVTRFSESNSKGALSQYIGVDPEELLIEPSFTSDEVLKGDQFLICSDGLTDMVTEEQIAGILSTEIKTKDKVSSLIKTALDCGGKDNITVILIEVYNNIKAADIIIDELSLLLEKNEE